MGAPTVISEIEGRHDLPSLQVDAEACADLLLHHQAPQEELDRLVLLLLDTDADEIEHADERERSVGEVTLGKFTPAEDENGVHQIRLFVGNFARVEPAKRTAFNEAAIHEFGHFVDFLRGGDVMKRLPLRARILSRAAIFPGFALPAVYGFAELEHKITPLLMGVTGAIAVGAGSSLALESYEKQIRQSNIKSAEEFAERFVFEYELLYPNLVTVVDS